MGMRCTLLYMCVQNMYNKPTLKTDFIDFQVNGGLPKGFSSLVEAAKVAQPSKEAWDARRRVSILKSCRTTQDKELKMYLFMGRGHWSSVLREAYFS